MVSWTLACGPILPWANRANMSANRASSSRGEDPAELISIGVLIKRRQAEQRREEEQQEREREAKEAEEDREGRPEKVSAEEGGPRGPEARVPRQQRRR